MNKNRHKPLNVFKCQDTSFLFYVVRAGFFSVFGTQVIFFLISKQLLVIK